ncbi:MAG: aminoacetone oxidase family FAD-binding enzyme [Anaerolineaceae bacterium]|jgi:predicted Rossmann fold flavoprotein|nr:aminoacetone oxidase family FAD-binding enzyme [Anaerolineaceae bacterium]
MQTIGIIGAGPAGILAALEARKSDAEVLLFDLNDMVGRKLLVTGAGRCNLTNTRAASDRYHASSLAVVDAILKQFNHPDLLEYLHDLGILTQATPDGWVYPLSYSAANVASIFAAHLLESGADLHLSHKVNHILPQKQGFLLKFSTGQAAIFVDKLVVAVGGKAYPTLGSDGSIFPTLRALGHKIIPIQPALAPLIISQKAVAAIQGVRMDAGIRLFGNGKLLDETRGNIIFTKGGINGPGVMDISYLVSQHKHINLEVEINFISGYEDALKNIFARFAHSSIPINIVLGTVIPPKIASFALKNLHVPPDQVLSSFQNKDIRRILTYLSAYSLKIEGVRGFEFCQLSTGGVPLTEVDPQSLESKILPGLFFAGEVLDVHGPCGGYNLQWAFSSGVVAGRHAAQCPQTALVEG